MTSGMYYGSASAGAPQAPMYYGQQQNQPVYGGYGGMNVNANHNVNPAVTMEPGGAHTQAHAVTYKHQQQPVRPSLYNNASRLQEPALALQPNPVEIKPAANVNLANNATQNNTSTVSASGLIRLTLRKPMGIVFEPMTQNGKQRGVRICDLPRTGAAALSGKLQVGDELLSINDKTMSRLSFDEILDFIIDADADKVDLLFRRPKKDGGSVASKSRNGQQRGIKWAEEDEILEEGATISEDKVVNSKSKSKSQDRESSHRDRDRDRSEKHKSSSNNSNSRSRYGSRKKGKKRDDLASESFLDMLIDTLCNTSGYNNDPERDDESYYDDDSYSRASFDDESTIDTRDTRDNIKNDRGRDRRRSRERERDREYDDDTVDDTATLESKDSYSDIPPPSNSKSKKHAREHSNNNKAMLSPVEEGIMEEETKKNDVKVKATTILKEDIPVPEVYGLDDLQPMEDVVYDDREENMQYNVNMMEEEEHDQTQSIDGSVLTMPTLDGMHISPLARSLGKDYPSKRGLSVEETIQHDPRAFYRFVVQVLLDQHEPEKLRLIDKLLAKYEDREEYLIQKLQVRYNKEKQQGMTPTIQEEEYYEEGISSPPMKDDTVDRPVSNSNYSLGSFASENAKQRFTAKTAAARNAAEDGVDSGNDGVLTPDERYPEVCLSGQEDDEQIDDVNMEEKEMQTQPVPVEAAPPEEDSDNMDINDEEDYYNMHRVREEKHDDVVVDEDDDNRKIAVEQEYEQPRARQSPQEEHDIENTVNNDVSADEQEEGSYYSGEEESEYSDDMDGTSPALIAQVSELLNFVYGKTSVPGQIDRVSTIMRAYEGRETVLLELLETKALIKANSVKAEQGQEVDESADHPVDFNPPDDISSVSGSSSKYRNPPSHAPPAPPPELNQDQHNRPAAATEEEKVAFDEVVSTCMPSTLLLQ